MNGIAGKYLRSRIRLALLACAVLGLFAGGCSRGRNKVYPVEGKVVLAGKPVARAQVIFHPEDPAAAGAIRPVGQVDDQGNFTLTSYRAGDGAPEGQYRVAVIWYQVTARRNATEGDPVVSQNFLPDIYARAESTPLRATVSKGTNKLDTFELKSK